MQTFCKYDYARVIPSLLESLYEFGCNARAWDHLPLNSELIQDIIDAGPDATGGYLVDEDSLSLDEINVIMEEFGHYQDMCDEHLHTLQTYFPELTWGDLSTQDY